MTEKVSALLVAVLVVSCFGWVSCKQGTILNRTLLQEVSGGGLRVFRTLVPSNVVEVRCKKEDAVVFDDPWWLEVTFDPLDGSGSLKGWVADADVDCGNAGYCDVSEC